MAYSPGTRPASTKVPSSPPLTCLTNPEAVPTASISALPSAAPASLSTLPRMVAVVVWASACTAISSQQVAATADARRPRPRLVLMTSSSVWLVTGTRAIALAEPRMDRAGAITVWVGLACGPPCSDLSMASSRRAIAWRPSSAMGTCTVVSAGVR